MALEMSGLIHRNPVSSQYSFAKCFQGSATSPLEETSPENETGTWIQGRGHPQEQNSIRILIGGLDLKPHFPFSPDVFDEIRVVHDLPRDPLQCHKGSFFTKYVLDSGKIALILYVKYAQVCLAMEYDPRHNITTTVVRLRDATSVDILSRRLTSLRRHAWHPLLLPTVMIEYMVTQLPDTVDDHNSGISTTYKRRPSLVLSITKRKAQECSQILNSLQDFPTTPVSPDTSRSVAAGMYCVDSKLSHLIFSVQNILNQCDMHASINNEDLQSATKSLSRSADYNAKIMTLLSVIYLPLSAVAGVFSTTFFNFEPEGGRKVSRDFWIFLATTAIFSLFTLLHLVRPDEWRGMYCRTIKGLLP
ncbi:hypothetical protein BDV26DRAFT_127546 [Aspergillus bertholletiae]|uniref:Cora-like Mg2+ transporter protein-domain-containing protein n=1 Tax=Aspergillus bertholletiae TaxID=1226010 RepID=A0A5N7BFT1_9EURO|nr:hypothetical protein BDV26DRAFT_127546 [Aspergillus bertholletiae]